MLENTRTGVGRWQLTPVLLNGLGDRVFSRIGRFDRLPVNRPSIILTRIFEGWRTQIRYCMCQRHKSSFQRARPQDVPTQPIRLAFQDQSNRERLYESAPRVHRATHDPQSDRSRGILDAFLNTCDRWRLEEGDRAVLLGVSRSRSLAEAVQADYDAPATRDAEDRAGFVVGISIGLGVLFGDDEESECIWLNSPRPQLGDMTPLGYMLEGSMIALLAVSEMVRRERGL